MRPPTSNELVGPPLHCLDQKWAIKNFLDKTQAEAEKLCRSRDVTEDFTYKAAEGLYYYLPSALGYPPRANAPKPIRKIFSGTAFCNRAPPHEAVSWDEAAHEGCRWSQSKCARKQMSSSRCKQCLARSPGRSQPRLSASPRSEPAPTRHRNASWKGSQKQTSARCGQSRRRAQATRKCQILMRSPCSD